MGQRPGEHAGQHRFSPQLHLWCARSRGGPPAPRCCTGQLPGAQCARPVSLGDRWPLHGVAFGGRAWLVSDGTAGPPRVPAAGAPKRQITRMGNKATGGPFSPLVVVVRNIVGEKEFNKLRGKGISLHSQGGGAPPASSPAGTPGSRLQTPQDSPPAPAWWTGLTGLQMAAAPAAGWGGVCGGGGTARAMRPRLGRVPAQRPTRHRLPAGCSDQGLLQDRGRRQQAGPGSHPPGKEERCAPRNTGCVHLAAHPPRRVRGSPTTVAATGCAAACRAPGVSGPPV